VLKAVEMQQQATVTEQYDVQRPKPRGKPWRPGQSGNPSGSRVNTRAIVLFADMAADFGGVDALSGVDRAMLMQACRLMARGARAKSADDAVRLTSEARRILMGLRKRASAAATSTESFAAIAQRAQAESEARRAAELAADEMAVDGDTPTSDRPKGKAMALDSKLTNKPDADLAEEIARDAERVCRGEII
jgi:hypothetical protein